MNNPDSKDAGRIKRGEAPEEIIVSFSELSGDELINRLKDKIAANRSAAAIVLGKRKYNAAIIPLCNAIKTEKALYSKINMCNALSDMGEASLPELIPLLGKIGNNRHKKLPEKGFYKFSYPLPRDIIARTIIRIGVPALNNLASVLKSGSREAIPEAIDAIGHITFYSKYTSLENELIKLFFNSQSDQLILWKILRAFQAFNSPTVNRILEEVLLNSTEPLFRWESARSMAMNGSVIKIKLKKLISSDPDKELKKIIKRFWEERL